MRVFLGSVDAEWVAVAEKIRKFDFGPTENCELGALFKGEPFVWKIGDSSASNSRWRGRGMGYCNGAKFKIANWRKFKIAIFLKGSQMLLELGVRMSWR